MGSTLGEGGITWKRLPNPTVAWEHLGKCYWTSLSCEVPSLGKLSVQREEQGGCCEALRGDGNVTPQELMCRKQEPLALCSVPVVCELCFPCSMLSPAAAGSPLAGL